METFTKFDASDYLDSEEMIAEYLTAALEDSNPDVFLAALADVAKARGMSAIAKLPEPLLREVGDFVDFLLARYAQETQSVPDEVPASLLAVCRRGDFVNPTG